MTSSGQPSGLAPTLVTRPVTDPGAEDADHARRTRAVSTWDSFSVMVEAVLPCSTADTITPTTSETTLMLIPNARTRAIQFDRRSSHATLTNVVACWCG